MHQSINFISKCGFVIFSVSSLISFLHNIPLKILISRPSGPLRIQNSETLNFGRKNLATLVLAELASAMRERLEKFLVNTELPHLLDVGYFPLGKFPALKP